MIRRGLILGLVLGFVPMIGQAASISVSPAFQNVVVTPAMSGKDITVTLTNQSAVGQTYALTSADFGTLDESGGVALLGTPITELEHRYGLVSWMTVDRNTVFIAPAKSVVVTVHIDNRPSLAPGGHYAALLATAVAEPGSDGAPAKVNLKQVITSLILVRKDGGAEPGLSLVDAKRSPSASWRLPEKLELRFRDPGNVHVVPHGTLEIKDPAGRVISRGIINEDSVTVFPESFRKMTSKLQALKSAKLPGRYTIVAHYRYDDSASTATYTQSFWYLGQILTDVIGLGILLLLGGVGWVLRKHLRKRRGRAKRA